MDLFPYERRQLDLLEGELRADAPRLAAMFDVFSRLARADGKPPAEEQFAAEGPWRERALARQRGRQRIIVTMVVIAFALIAFTVLGFL